MKDIPFFEKEQVKIYLADFLSLKSIKENSIDLAVTSPPYNVEIEYSLHDDKTSYAEYLQFTKKWLQRCILLVKNDGRFCLNIPLDKNKGGQQSVYADITSIAKKIGWKYHSTIVWNEQNISRRTAWGSWLSASAPYVIAPVEMIVVFYKGKWKKTSGTLKSNINKEEFMNWTNGVWTFSGESKMKVGHPAPFPVELPKRCIKLFTFVGDTVLDPFLGSGSTLLACLETDRKGIGVEIDKNYCEIAKKRLMRFTKQLELTTQKDSIIFDINRQEPKGRDLKVMDNIFSSKKEFYKNKERDKFHNLKFRKK
jgi:site-specific DNA-methyltransferase (adenine-specific)